MEEFTRESIIALLKELNTLLEEHGQEAELYIVGGSAMALAWDMGHLRLPARNRIRI